MPQRNMRAHGRTPILQDESCCTRQGKNGGGRRGMPQKNAHGTKIRQTERKTCAVAELV
jgi:hypothetical protein